MALTYNQVKSELAAASALTGGKFVAFDAQWYVLTYQNTPIRFENAGLDQDRGLAHFSGDPLDHYVQYGAAAGLQPSRYFDTAFYRSEYADTRSLGEADVLVHYAKFGVNEGRAPNASMKLFDGARYLAENADVVPYVNANLAQFGGSASNGAIAHYVKFGALEQRIGYSASGVPLVIAPLPTSAALNPTSAGNGVILLSANTNAGQTTLTGNKAVADGTAAPTLRLVGDAAIRIDFTNKADQITGLDLNGNGVIQPNGVENNIRGANILTAKNFTIVDAYPRNPVNEGDRSNNFLGNINFDGTGNAGDGVNTNGNIFLGGLGRDVALGGIGNDFLTGGGKAAANSSALFDVLSGGRNADFFFSELSLLTNTDGNSTSYDGGITADDSAAGSNAFGSGSLSTQDSDWILLEASDDDEPTTVNLGAANNKNGGSITTRAGQQVAELSDIENVDASGDLYGFLNKTGAMVGQRIAEVADGRLPAHTFGAENYGVGSSAQLIIIGSTEANKLIGGYDNDQISGDAGSDLIMGGKLSYLLNNRNNPNLLTADGKGLELNVNSVGVVSDGRDILLGGTGNDGILFGMDGGTVDGGTATGSTGNSNLSGDESDTLYLTNFTMGRMKGWTTENEATSSSKGESDALAALTTDSTIRLDLGVGAAEPRRGYGGADVNNNFLAGQSFTADQTQYKAGVARSTVQDIENVIATGLGWAGSPGSVMDFVAAGGNGAADQIANSFRNQQNFLGTTTAVYDLRGVSQDGQDARTYNNIYTDTQFGYTLAGAALTTFDPGDNTLYSGNKNDIIEGRRGDDLQMGNFGDDTFIVSLTRGDGFDVIHRQVDANKDDIWDGTFAQDFRVKGQTIAGTPTKITFNIENPDAVQGVSVTYAGVAVTAGGAAVIDATTLAGIATAINAAFQAIDKNITAAVEGTKLVVVDAQGRNASSAALAGDPAFKNGLESVVQGTGTSTSDEFDRLIFKAYQDDAANLGVDDTKNGLGGNAYAKDLVVDFTGGTTTLAERQEWRIQFQNLNQSDLVTVSINGKTFSATVGTAYDGTQILGETTDAFVTRFLDQFNARQLDISSRSGDVIATQADVITVPANVTNESVLILEELETSSPDNREHVFMQTPVVTIVNAGGAASGTVRIANTSDSSVELFQFDGRNGQINANDVLFVGQTGSGSNYDADKNLRTEDGSVFSYAVLQTAATAGGTLTGKDATVVTINTVVTEMHGHDLLIGGDGNDVINGLGGDDTIIGSKGADTVNGGADAALTTKQRFIANQTAITTDANANLRVDYTDTLLYRESDFGDGSNFTIALDGALASRGKGTVTAVDAKGVSLGVTAYDDIELVRTLNNTRADTLDFVALSNSVATATGVSALSNEGVIVNLIGGLAGSDIRYNVDLNASDTLVGTSELNVLVGKVMGVENLLGGNANDQVTMDETQLDAKNLINLGSQIDQTSPSPTLVEGFDIVTYNYSAGFKAAAANIPVVTVKPESGTNTDTVTFAGGVLTADAPDTLIGVENLNIADVAISVQAADKLDLSGIAGATVNYTTLGQTVAESLGGDIVTTTVAHVEGNTLQAGGVSKTGAGLGNELLQITGIQQIEQVIGSTGSDRVLLGETTALAGANVRSNLNNAPAPNFADQALGFNFHGRYTLATRTFDTTTANVDNKGLYTFDLGDGDDALDYRLTGGTDDIAVVVDFTATSTDWVVVDDIAGGGFTFPAGVTNNRVDKSVNVERYFGSTTAVGQRNAIDLTRATEATTVVFGAEQAANLNEYTDPNGRNTTITGINTAAATAADQVTGISVATTAAASTVVARFMNASASAGGNAEALWNFVEGSNFNDTVVMSATQDRLKDETLNLRGGSNSVDYTNGVVAGKNDSYTATIGDITPVASSTLTHANATVVHTSVDGVAGTDTVTIDRQWNATRGFVDGALLLIGSQNTADTISAGGLAVPQSVTFINGLKTNAAATKVTEAAAVTDIMGVVGGGHNRVDLGSGAGNTGGSVIQDVSLGINGQSDGTLLAPTALVNDNVVTSIRGWENITGSAFNDRLFGNDNANVIDGGSGDDILQGRGGGDTLTGGAGADRFIYAGPGESGHVLGQTTVSAALVDILADFDNGSADTLVVDASVSAAAGGFSLLNTTVFTQGALATLDLVTNGAITLITAAPAADFDLYDMTAVVAGIGASAVVTAGNITVIGQQAILYVDSNTALTGNNKVGMYLWTASTVGDVSVSPAELRLLAVINDNSVGGAESDTAFTVSDLAVRAGGQNGKQTLNLNAGVRDELVFSALGQSQYGAIDSIGTAASGGPVGGPPAILMSGHFVTGIDKIDLSALNLGATNGLLINAIISIDRTGIGNQITDANAPNFFYATTGDATTQQRAVVVEFDGDDIDGATFGTQSRGRIFIDLNGDGQLNTTQDMFIDFVSDDTSSLLAGVVGTQERPVFTDFIFVI